MAKRSVKKKLRNPERNEVGEAVYSYAALLDLMGTGAAFSKFKRLPTNDAEREQFEKAIKSTLQPVNIMRALTRRCVANAPIATRALKNELPAHVCAAFQRCKIEPKFTSDTALLAGTLAGEGEIPVVGLYHTLRIISLVMAFMLSEGYPIRGGLCVNIAIIRSDREYYGPVLSQAVKLEANTAKWPRIVVHKSVLEYLRYIIAEPSASGELYSAAKVIASACQAYIEPDPLDEEGYFMLDFLGEVQQRNCDSDLLAEFPEMVKKIYAFAKAQAYTYSQENPKLYRYYRNLLAYVESRLTVWEINKDLIRS